MVQSNAAQTSTSAWKRHTLVLLAVMLVARIICFVVLGNEMADRRGYVVSCMHAELATWCGHHCNIWCCCSCGVSGTVNSSAGSLVLLFYVQECHCGC